MRRLKFEKYLSQISISELQKKISAQNKPECEIYNNKKARM